MVKVALIASAHGLSEGVCIELFPAAVEETPYETVVEGRQVTNHVLERVEAFALTGVDDGVGVVFLHSMTGEVECDSRSFTSLVACI